MASEETKKEDAKDEKVPAAAVEKEGGKKKGGIPRPRPKTPIGWMILFLFAALIAWKAGVGVAILFLLFVSGAPLFTIMLAAAALGAYALTDGSDALHLVASKRGFDGEFDGMVEHVLNVGLGDQVQVMSTIPLFIYAGYVLAESGTADRLVRFANAMLGWIPGGLAIVTIATCALFTVFTGASGVTIIALGGVLMPALVRVGYPERFSVGLIAGTGSVGLLFPPALPLFIYGTVYGLTNLDPENWDTRRFLFAGIVPGLLLLTMLSVVAISVAIYRKLPTQKFSFKELGESFLLALPELFVPFGVILGLAKGIGLPEIAALTVVYVVLLEIGVSRLLVKLGVNWGKPLDPFVLWSTTREAMAMVGAIFIIIFASTALTNFMVTAKVPELLVHWTQEHVEQKWVFLLAINILLLVVGTVMDIFSAIVVVLPLIGPIAKAYGIDPYHLGVIFLLNLEVGYLHPPVGLNLFITSVKFNRPITEVMWATMPFLGTMIAALLIVTYVPSLTAISVPEPERTGTVNNMIVMIHTQAEEGRAVKEVKIVDVDGNELKDQKGQPVVKKLEDCAAITEETKKSACQQLFFDVSNCKTDADVTKCANRKIAEWTVSNLNGDVLDQTKAIINVTDVALVKGDGTPVKDKAGQPITKHFAECDKLEGSYQETCRDLFIQASSCKIVPPEDGNVDACIATKSGDWVDSNMSEESP